MPKFYPTTPLKANFSHLQGADDGVVTLEGDVDSYQDIREAVSAVRPIPGVKAVNAELRVNYDPYYRPFDYDPRY